MKKQPFTIGERVEVVEGYYGLVEIDIYEGDICVVTYIEYLPECGKWACTVVKEEDYTGQVDEDHSRWTYRFKSMKPMPNAERVRLRKEQLANGA